MALLDSKRDGRETAELLRSFVVDYLRVSPDCHWLERLAELPAGLRRHVGKGRRQQYFWYAWDQEGQVHLITGEPAIAPGSMDRPTLRICRFTPEGDRICCGLWQRLGTAYWHRTVSTQRDSGCEKLHADELFGSIYVTH